MYVPTQLLNAVSAHAAHVLLTINKLPWCDEDLRCRMSDTAGLCGNAGCRIALFFSRTVSCDYRY